MKYVVTGANRGLGLEFVKQLLARGETVVATVRDPEAAEALRALAPSAEGALVVRGLDVGDPDSVAAFAEAMAGETVDVLINNAGIYPNGGQAGAIDYDGMRRGFEINTLGPLRVMEALLPALRRGGRKLAVNVTSKMGSIADNTSGGSYAYRVSKTALNMAVRCLAHDLASEGLSVFVIHPGWVLTDMGGPNALIDTETSIGGMLKVIDSAGPDASGRFLEWNGKEIPW